jgi:hypothetical protein
MIIFWCEYFNCSASHKGGGLRFTICVCYSCQMALSFGFKVSFDNIVAYRAVAMQQPRDGRIYQGRFWATARYTHSRSNESTRNNGDTVGQGVFLCGPCWDVIRKDLHRDPASRRRRRNGKSQIWGSKIWSRVPPEKDYAGEGKQHIQKRDPSSRQRGRPRKTRP